MVIVSQRQSGDHFPLKTETSNFKSLLFLLFFNYRLYFSPHPLPPPMHPAPPFPSRIQPLYGGKLYNFHLHLAQFCVSFTSNNVYKKRTCLLFVSWETFIYELEKVIFCCRVSLWRVNVFHSPYCFPDFRKTQLLKLKAFSFH